MTALTEASIVARAFAVLAIAGELKSPPDAADTLGITKADITEAFRNVPTRGAPLWSRLRLAFAGETPAPVQQTKLVTIDDTTGEHVCHHAAAPDIVVRGSSSRSNALAAYAAELVNALYHARQRVAELEAALTELAPERPATTPPAPKPPAPANGPEAPRRGRPRPERWEGNVRWLRCTCETACGPNADGWWPEDAFKVRSDRNNGARRSLAIACYSRYQRSKRVTVAVMQEIEAVGVAFRYDPAGSPTRLICRCCGEPIKSGAAVVSDGPVPLIHAACARAEAARPGNPPAK